MQMQGDFVFTGLADRAFGQADFAFFNLNTGIGHGGGDIDIADGTEQLAFGAGLGGNADSQRLDLLTALLGIGPGFGRQFFQLGTTGFDFRLVFLGSNLGLALRQQIVACETGFNVYQITNVAQAINFFI